MLLRAAWSTAEATEVFWELLTCQPQLCAWLHHGTDLSRNCAKTPGEQGGNTRQAAQLHQGQDLPDLIVVFCDGVTASVDKGRAIYVIYMDFCRLWYSHPKHPSVNWGEMDSMGLQWIKNWLNGYIVANGSKSWWISMTTGIPQGSVFGTTVI